MFQEAGSQAALRRPGQCTPLLALQLRLRHSIYLLAPSLVFRCNQHSTPLALPSDAATNYKPPRWYSTTKSQSLLSRSASQTHLGLGLFPLAPGDPLHAPLVVIRGSCAAPPRRLRCHGLRQLSAQPPSRILHDLGLPMMRLRPLRLPARPRGGEEEARFDNSVVDHVQ